MANREEDLRIIRSINDEIRETVKLVSKENDVKRSIRKVLTDINNLAEQSAELAKDEKNIKLESEDIAKRQTKLANNRKKAESEIKFITEKLLELQNERLTGGNNINTDLNKQIKSFEKIQEGLGDIISQSDKLKKNLDEASKGAKEVENSLGGKSFGAMGDIADKLGLGKFSQPLKDAAQASKDSAANMVKQNLEAKKLGKTKMPFSKGAINSKSMLAGVKSLGPALTKALGPAALIAMVIEQIVKAFKLLDQLSGEVAKSMGISAAEGESLVKSMNQAANSTGELDVSTKDLVKAQMEMNQMLGTSVEFSAEMAEEFSLIQQRTGLSTEAMSFFAKESLRAGTSMKDQLQIVSNVNEEMSAQTGINLSLKEIQEGVASASKATFLATKGGVKELTKAVFKARQFGITMSQLDSTASSLLSFESSIASELEAELLLGKDLNLEKARQAALDNDLETLSSEIAKNVGSAAEFQEMNRIQQEAIAKSVGMQREDLAGMLLEQENLAAIKKADFKSMSDAQKFLNEKIEEGMTMEQAKNEMVKKGLSDTLAGQLASQTRAEKMAKFQEKIGDMFMLIAEAFTPMIDELMEVLPPLLKGLQPIFMIIGQIVGLVVKVMMPSIINAVSYLTNAFEGIGKMFGGVIDVFKGLYEIIFGDTEKGFKMIEEGAKKGLAGMLQFILAPIQALIDGSLYAINMISEFFGGEKIQGINLTESIGGAIGLASGGIVTGPTNAIIGEGGEPEAVVPLSKADSVGFGGNSETNSLLKELISVVKAGGTVTLDGQKVGQALSISNYSTQ